MLRHVLMGVTFAATLQAATLDEQLLSAVQAGQTAQAAALLAKGARVDTADGKGSALIHLAVQQRNAPLLRLLVANGADLQARDAQGIPAIDQILNSGDAVLVRAAFGALSPAKPSAGEQRRPLTIHDAARKGSPELCEFFLKLGFPADLPDADGNTPLNLAAMKGAEDVVALLLRHGANVRTADRQGWTPLHGAALSGNARLVQTLVGAGAELEAVEQGSGMSPLYVAAKWAKDESFAALLRVGARTDVKDASGKSLRAYAAAEGTAKIRAALGVR